MSLFDSASVVITPSGYKEDKLYSIKPTDGSGDLVVTRATTATRVNSAGLIEVVPYNFIRFSEQFDNAVWAISGSTISVNATTAPNGTLTADKFIANATNSTHQLFQTTDSNAYVFSVYAKAGEETVFSMWIANATKRAEFNLATGTIPLSTVTNSTIVDVGNGWYRCSVYDTSPSTTYRIYGRTGGVYLGNGVDGLFLWGAQLNLGTSAKEYFPTTDRLNVPRLDYTNSSCPSILVEPQRTNITLQSEDLSTTWYTAGGLLTSNATTAPDGNTTADKIKADNTNGIHVYQQTLVVAAATVYTMSIFVKSGEYTFLELADSSTLKGQTFNLTAKTISAPQTGGFSAASSSKIEDYGNGWLRCSITYTTASVAAFFRVSLSNGTSTTFTGNNTNGLFVWGAQLEAGSYATSYIPTVASSVTRNADVISKTGISSLIGQTEGTLFVDVNYKAESIVKIYLNLGTSTSNYIAIGTKANNKIGMEVLNSGVQVNAESTSTYSTNQRLKIAMTYKLNDFKLYVNGILQATDTSGTVPAKAEIYLGSYGNGTQQAMDGINSAQLYKTALSDTECINLTTI
jgi:hypothetical protein